MPLYQQLLIARDIAKVADMTKLMQQCAKTVYENGGIMRAVENHGVRALSHRLRNRRANEEEQKYHWKARYVSTYFDANPKVLKELERVLRLNENVLRFFTIKSKTQADHIRVQKGWKSRTWESYSLDELEKKKLRETVVVLDGEELKDALAAQKRRELRELEEEVEDDYDEEEEEEEEATTEEKREAGKAEDEPPSKG